MGKSKSKRKRKKLEEKLVSQLSQERAANQMQPQASTSEAPNQSRIRNLSLRPARPLTEAKSQSTPSQSAAQQSVSVRSTASFQDSSSSSSSLDTVNSQRNSRPVEQRKSEEQHRPKCEERDKILRRLQQELVCSSETLEVQKRKQLKVREQLGCLSQMPNRANSETQKQLEKRLLRQLEAARHEIDVERQKQHELRLQLQFYKKQQQYMQTPPTACQTKSQKKQEDDMRCKGQTNPENSKKTDLRSKDDTKLGSSEDDEKPIVIPPNGEVCSQKCCNRRNKGGSTSNEAETRRKYVSGISSHGFWGITGLPNGNGDEVSTSAFSRLKFGKTTESLKRPMVDKAVDAPNVTLNTLTVRDDTPANINAIGIKCKVTDDAFSFGTSNAMDSVATTEIQSYREPALQAPFLRSKPCPFVCPYCHRRIVTITVRRSSKKTHIVACILVVMCLWPFACLPYCLECFSYTRHYCPCCRSYLGTFYGKNRVQ